jgi:hypothetical protein
MVQITIEYMIMIPLLILQIFLFPYTASLIMNSWSESRETLALQETASSLGSSIQQLYSALNHDSISAGTVNNNKLELPLFIEGYPYAGNGTIRTVLESPLNSSKVLEITLYLNGTKVSAKSSVILGENANWAPSNFISNSALAGISGQKIVNGLNSTIQLSFTS